MPKLIGSHLSTSKGIHTLQPQMDALEADTSAFFTGSPRSFNVALTTNNELIKWKSATKNPELLLPHAPYIINLANKRYSEKHRTCMQKNLDKLNRLNIKLYNFHPGSDTDNLGKKRALELIADNINKLNLDKLTLVIEIMAGDGKKVGCTFEEIAAIIAQVHQKEQIGVCLDTCHMFAGGYDIRTEDKFQKIMEDFDRIVGIRFLKGMHLNDSKHFLGSKKDRHEQLGKGHIGMECFRYIMNSDYFENIPMILETPDPSSYSKELKMLRTLVRDKENLC